jgi:hypothetical protein
MNGFAFITHVTRLLQRRLQSGSEEATVKVLIVNDSYGGKGIHWWTAVVYFGPCKKRPIPHGPMGSTIRVEPSSDDDGPDDSGGRVAGKICDAQ